MDRTVWREAGDQLRLMYRRAPLLAASGLVWVTVPLTTEALRGPWLYALFGILIVADVILMFWFFRRAARKAAVDKVGEDVRRAIAGISDEGIADLVRTGRTEVNGLSWTAVDDGASIAFAMGAAVRRA